MFTRGKSARAALTESDIHDHAVDVATMFAAESGDDVTPERVQRLEAIMRGDLDPEAAVALLDAELGYRR